MLFDNLAEAIKLAGISLALIIGSIDLGSFKASNRIVSALVVASPVT